MEDTNPVYGEAEFANGRRGHLLSETEKVLLGIHFWETQGQADAQNSL